MSKHNKKSLEEILIETNWKPVYLNDKESGYLISNKGNLYSIKSKTLMSPHENMDGYLETIITVDGIRYNVSIHRLVAIAFVDNPDPANKLQVNHKNGNKLINEDWNLEWVTQKENIDHAIKTGLRDSFKGEGSPNNVYPEHVIHKICQMLEDGRSQKYISEILNVNKGIVNSIKRNKIWKHVSSQYNIPKPISRVPRPAGLREKVIDLISRGYENESILRLLELPDIRTNRTYIAVIKSELKSKVNSSTTIDQSTISS